MNDTISALDELIKNRLDAADREASYVAQLKSRGINKILEKVGEESTEFILAAKDAHTDAQSKPAAISEAADLLFHTMVSLSYLGLSTSDVLEELTKRMNISGLDEKAARSTKE